MPDFIHQTIVGQIGYWVNVVTGRLWCLDAFLFVGRREKDLLTRV